MSVLENVYNKFKDLEVEYRQVQHLQTREEFVRYLFGGNVDEGATILTEAIMCENPSSTEEIERFSSLKDIFNFFIKHKDNISPIISSFDDMIYNISTENDAFENIDCIMQTLSEYVNTNVMAERKMQSELLREKDAFHYFVSPDSSVYASLVDCKAFNIMSEAHAEICKTILGIDKEFIQGTVYLRRKTGAVKSTKKAAIAAIMQGV